MEGAEVAPPPSGLLAPQSSTSPNPEAEREQLLAFVKEVESHAQQTALDVTDLYIGLQGSLKLCSSRILASMEQYGAVVDDTAASITDDIEAMHNFISQCNKMKEDMEQVEEVAARIKGIRSKLDRFEHLAREQFVTDSDHGSSPRLPRPSP